jgi:beta-lactam-binding protein with PASTA domain
MSVSITLDSARYDVAPGSSFTVPVTVTNNGTKVEQFRISLRGLAGAKTTVEPPVLNLEGGRHQEAMVRVSVPVDAPIRAGRHVVGIHVWAQNDRSLQRLRELELIVAPNPGFTLAVAKRGRRNGRYQHATVHVVNTGNVPLRLRVAAEDPKNLVRVDLPEEAIEVGAFARQPLDALLRGPFRGVGAPVNHTVRFRAGGMQLEERTADYTMDQRAWLGKSVKPYLVIGLIGVAAFLLWPRFATVDDVVGLPLDAAGATLEAAGIAHEVRTENHPDPQGTIVETQPAAGETVRLGGPLGLFAETVTVVVSSGPAAIEVPRGLVDQSRPVAEESLSELRAFGVIIQFETAPSDDVAAERVVSTRPAAGEQLLAGETLTVIVSSGPAPFELPSFEGMNLGELNVAREQLGLLVDRLEREVDDPALDGVVVDQIPRPGESVRRGSTVTVWMGVYVEPEGEPPPDTESG